VEKPTLGRRIMHVAHGTHALLTNLLLAYLVLFSVTMFTLGLVERRRLVVRVLSLSDK
jgi:hypothetical protein